MTVAEILTLKETGLVSKSGLRVRDSLVYEDPVNLSKDNTFRGCCEIGAFSYVNPNSIVDYTRVGRYCSIARDVWLGPPQHEAGLFSTHPFVFETRNITAGFGELPAYQPIVGRAPCTNYPACDETTPSVNIGNDVWIGTRAIVMKGVTIGDGAIIGAGAVVTRDVEPYTIVAGLPARPIRKRFSAELIAQFLDLQWWRYDMSAVSNRVDYGQPQAVIDFMKARRDSGELVEFMPRKFRLEKLDGKLALSMVR